MTWFSYDAQGRPTWYVAAGDWKPKPPAGLGLPDWQAQLFQQSWEFDRPVPGRSDPIYVGEVGIKFQPNDASRLALQWRLYGETPENAWEPVECLRDFGIAAQGEPQRNFSNTSVTPAYSGGWTADGTNAWSFYQTVLAFTRGDGTVFRESAVLTTFDDSGRPVWLDATDQDAPEPSELALNVPRTLPYAYYFVTPSEYSTGRPNTPCDSGHGCSRRQWMPPWSDWTRTFQAPSMCDGEPCMTGRGRAVVQMAASAPGNPKGQAVTRLLPPSGPERGLRKITDLDTIHVDKAVCSADIDGTCKVSVSWSSTDDRASVRRVRLPGSTGPSTTAIVRSWARHGSLVHTLNAGDLVRFELLSWQNTVLHSTPSVRVEQLPLRIESTQVVLSSGMAPTDVRLSAEVYGGVPPLQVEYLVDNRSIGTTGNGTTHNLLWKAVGPGTYTVRFRVTDSSTTPRLVTATREFVVSAPAPANAPARTSVEQVSDSVGTLPGSFRVDESGAATYAVPLTLPPGRAGVAPQLGLQYSSQGGDGSLGRGWSLSGLSNIVRCRRTREAGDFNVTRPNNAVYEDFEGITFTDRDAFCLDGQRLIPAVSAAQTGCPAVAGHVATEMRTEIDSHQRICAYRSSSLPEAGPRAFSVESKDGQRRWYGLYNGQAQPSHPNAAVALPVLTQGVLDGPLYLWALTRSRDSVGNYIDYHYIPDMATQPTDGVYQRMGALLIHSVQYAGRETPAAAPHSEVRFAYLMGAPQRDHFVSGRRFSTSRRLQHIDVLDNNILQRRYKLSYLAAPAVNPPLPDDGRSQHLQSLQECAPENPGQPEGTHVCLRPTQFNYGGSDPGSLQSGTEHAGLDRPFGPPSEVARINTGSSLKFEGKKVADIDGDGLLDIVWIKDMEGKCDASHDLGSGGTDLVSVAFLRHVQDGATRKVRFENTPAFCTPAELLNRTWQHGTHPDESWFLYDYNRDGKADIFFRGHSVWHGFLATGNPAAPFDLSNDVLASSFIFAGNAVRFFPRPVDLNGDGLMDLIRVEQGRSFNTLKARLYNASSGNDKSGAAAWATEIPVNYEDPCLAALGLQDCSAALVGLFDEDGFERQIDLNGDGATDLFVAFDVSGRWPAPSGGGDPGNPGGPGYEPETFLGRGPSEMTTRRVMVGMQVTRVSATSIELAPMPGMWRLGGMGRYTQHVDLNGDGLVDTVSILPTQATGRSAFSLNTGGDTSYDQRLYGHMRCEVGLEASPGLADINGDGLPDFYAFLNGDLVVYRNRGGQLRVPNIAGGHCSTLFDQQPMQIARHGPNFTRLATWQGSNPPSIDRRELLFGDWDGDGLTDLLVLAPGGDSHLYAVHVPRVTAASEPAATRRADPPGLLTAITDGLGGRTEITYRPLSHPAIYRADRTLDDALYGRGSAVHDVRGAINVVARVQTSAPSFTATARKARLYYRYVGAKMQSGGRGLLGFREIHTIDPNHGPMEPGDTGAFALTISSYRQQFPFIGLPDTTERWVVREPWVETACFQNTAPCQESLDVPFKTPDQAWPTRARLLSDATEDYAFAWTSTPSIEHDAFNGQTRAPEPVQVRRIRSQEHTYDLRSGAPINASVQLYRYLAANGVADPYGNVLRTRSYVFSANPSPTVDGQDYTNYVSRTETLNTYLNDVAAGHWYPGRLSHSRASHRRSGPNGTEIVRVSNFDYYPSGSLRGLLRAETVHADGAYVLPQTAVNAVADQRDERLITYYRHDAYGNRTGTYTCDVNLREAACTTPDEDSFRLSRGAPLHVHRWSKTHYTSDGRFVRGTESPYEHGIRMDSEILAHTAYGQPLLVRGLNGDYTRYAYGRFGRGFYQWTQTVGARVDALNGGNPALGQGPALALGVEARTYYAWCSSAGGSADCPTGAVYRQTTEGTEQPKQWAYFDALARPVLQVGELLNMDTGLGLRRSAVCQDYDVLGRGFRQSAPRMLMGIDTPTSSHLQNYCEQVPAHHWTETEFDMLGRSIVQWSPEDSGRAKTELHYEGLVTRTTLPANGDSQVRQRIEERNVLGELVRVSDGENLGAVATYAYNATGDLLSVTRSGAGTTVVSRMYYDRQGRKIRTEDPDAGVWNYRYNGAGEVIAQYDGAYVQPALALPASATRILQEFDGRGRRVMKSTGQGDGQAGVLHHWTYDLSSGSPFGTLFGVLTFEASQGGYDASGHNGVGLERSYHYDDLGRPVGSGTRFDFQGRYQRASAHYDTRGRIWKTMDASHRWLKTEYGARGFQLAQCESSALDAGTGCGANHENTYVRVQAVDAWGKVTREQRGNNLDITSAYTASSGRLISRCMGDNNCDLQLDSYHWDPLGNLLWRERRASTTPGNQYNTVYPKYRETFAYDSLNRVTSGQLGLYTTTTAQAPALSASSLAMAYDALGNICQRSVNGSTLYMHYLNSAGCNGSAAGQNSAGTPGYASPHALTRVSASVGAAAYTSYGYDAHGNQVSAQNIGGNTALPANRTVHYTAEQQAWRMAQGNELTRFFYGPDGARYKRIDQGNGSTTQTLYLGNVELILKNSTPQIRRYIAGVALMEIHPEQNTRTVKRLLHDHLGSVSLVVSNLNRSVLERYDYDAFGQRRAALGDPRGGWSWGPSSPRETNRGYTGHEMLDAFGLVHMNGRVYDSRTARFLQADPFVQEPNNPQNFNRFTYLWNNPLNATDPSGYLGVKERQAAATILTIVAVAFQQYGAASALKGWGVVAYYAAVGAASSGIATQSWDGAMWGAFSGAVSAGWSLGFDTAGTALWQQALIRGTSDGILSTIRGGKFGSAFAAAGLSTLAGYARQPEGTMGQLVMRTLVGGTVSAATGGKFANGAASAAMAFAAGRRFAMSSNSSSAELANPRRGQVKDERVSRLAESEGNLALKDAPDEGFSSHAEAAKFARSQLRPIADKYDTEIGARIFSDGLSYHLGTAVSDGIICALSNPCTVNLARSISSKGQAAGDFHTHPNNTSHSDPDIALAVGHAISQYNQQWHSYVSAQGGQLYYFNGSQGARGATMENLRESVRVVP